MGGALVALWLASAVAAAIESIPLFPKLMQVVGLGYTVWFSSRHLLFKENRDELAAKIKELKRQVLGLNDDGKAPDPSGQLVLCQLELHSPSFVGGLRVHPLTIYSKK
ncbi:hypothetical protein SLEP1_g29051 [Rubroshorea leprosula]|uniref:Cyanobacterial aminoacyl-tRNA synthetase CAAD domain-containing protein n=1 Tax=Rubroshorea leprosula TaxID=152421 RepID=A0AAV5K2R2_9ROSI|nr:hypothetical protein SLEP1_g29051 [Rubroshorea leprosula]